MRFLLFIITIFSICFDVGFAQEANFGKYRYTQYLGIQQQLQNQRARALRYQRIYNQSPTRNIKYPTMNNPYPNIQQSYSGRMTPKQRYSPSYYRSL